MRIVLAFLVGLGILVGCAGTATARTKLINTDDEILDLGLIPDELPDDLRERVEQEGYDHVGYFYARVAVLGADVWSWSGKFVFYRKQAEIKVEGLRTVRTTYYAELSDELVDQYGWKTPIEYRIPVGLLVLACMVEFAIVARKKRRARGVLIIGVALLAFAAILFALGMTWQVAFPLLLGLFHVVIALPFFQPASNAEAAAAMDDDDDEPEPPLAPKPTPARASQPMLPPAPSFEKDPFRAPPRPPPIVVERAPTLPAAAPIVHDDRADGPKLLR